MVIDTGAKIFRVSCSVCDWEDDVMVRNRLLGSSPILDIPVIGKVVSTLAFGGKLPSKCPKCGGSVTTQDLHVRF